MIVVSCDTSGNGGGGGNGNGGNGSGGNGNGGDTTALTVTITSSESTITALSPFSVTITFSEEVTGFVRGDITVGNGGASNLQTSDNTVFAADITPSGEGSVTVDVAVGVANDSFSGSKSNTAASQFSITYDITAPTVSDGTITISNVATTSLTLSWSKATDSASAQADLQYKVYYSESDNIDTVENIEENGTAPEGWTTDIATKDVTGLTAATNYYFNLIVRDEAGIKTAYTSVLGRTIFVLQTNPSVTTDSAYSITVDTNYIYVAGGDSSPGGSNYQ